MKLFEDQKSLEKLAITIMLIATFTLLFQLASGFWNLLVLSIILVLVNGVVGRGIMHSKEKVVGQLYSIILFLTNMIVINAFYFILDGTGATSQMAVFYFSLTLTILLTVFDFYPTNPNRNR